MFTKGLAIYEDTFAPMGILPTLRVFDIFMALIMRIIIRIIRKQLVFFTFMPLDHGHKMTSLVFFAVREISPFQ